jgi:hypothetical protein
MRNQFSDKKEDESSNQQEYSDAHRAIQSQLDSLGSSTLLANHRCESNIGANRTQLAVSQPALSKLPRKGLLGANATNLPQRGFMGR